MRPASEARAAGAHVRSVVAIALALLAASCGSAAMRAANAGHSSTTTTATTTATTTGPLPGAGRPPVVVGDKNTPEQFVLGELYEQALAAEGFSVSIDNNIGPIDVSLRALHQGSLDLYPEYINVWDDDVAHQTRAFPSARAAYAAGQRYALGHGLRLLNPTPFSDTDAIAVTDYFAYQHGLSTIADLRKLEPLTLGGPPQFQSGALRALEQNYGFSPSAFKMLPLGGQYVALDQGTVEAADVSTSDGELATGDYRLLADPSHVLGWGNVVPVVTQKALDAEGPTFVATINQVSALLTLPVMRQLNEQVNDHVSPATVATQFLQTHGLLAPGQGS